MKTLGKLQINPDRIMKHAELTALRGGYGGTKFCEFYMGEYNWGSGYFASQEECDTFLDTYFDPLNYCACP
jgi:hypothetical protein